jgi:dolichol-phosphate mannosyltransferase
MLKGTKVAIVIPFYNEEDTFKYLFYRIDGVYKILKDDYDLKFILVNDGSTDRSGEMLEKKYKDAPFMDIVCHEKNMGYGAGLKSGFRRALEGGYNYILTVDADTNYDQFLIPHFIYEFNPEREDILAGSPWHPECSKANFPLVRLVLSYSMAKMYQFVLSPECPPLTCYSSCFRLYKREVLEDINHNGNDFLANAEIVSRALLRGYRVRELPINVNYRLFGTSKMRLRMIIKQLRYMYFLLRHKKELQNPGLKNSPGCIHSST